MKVQLSLYAAAQKKITTQEAKDRRLFGPVYHGSDADGRESIQQHGFKIFEYGDKGKANGYMHTNYSQGKPAPVDHLGYGVYFTTSKTRAKMYNGNSVRGLKEYYLDVPRLETINFGSPNTMMAWWIRNGYDFSSTVDRHTATKHLTENLKNRLDAVWYKGKGLRTLLDGDQVVVFDPSRVYEIDDSGVKGLVVGGKVRSIHDKRIGVILDIRKPTTPANAQEILLKIRRDILNAPDSIEVERLRKYEKMMEYQLTDDPTFYTVKWNRGGTEYNVKKTDITPRV